MPRETIEPEEVKFVAREYSLRRPIEVIHISRGSRAIAKAHLRSVDGDWMVKRRPESAASGLELVHAFQGRLGREGVPVASLRENSDGATVTVHAGRAYELFGWVSGTRGGFTEVEAAAAGVAVGSLLRVGATYGASDPSFADPSHPRGVLGLDVDRLVQWIVASHAGTDADELGAVLRSVVGRGRRAYDAAESIGIADAPRAFVHGDLHAGNMLFADGRLAAILDFDNARHDLRVREVATAALSIGSEPRDSRIPSDWRHEQNLSRTSVFLAGAREGLGGARHDAERRALPWLMIEVCITEALERISAAGCFDQHAAADFLDFVDRKTGWIERHAVDIAAP